MTRIWILKDKSVNMKTFKKGYHYIINKDTKVIKRYWVNYYNDLIEEIRKLNLKERLKDKF